MTKKFVNALSKDVSAAGRSRFLIPARDGSAQFEEIETGKRHDVGYLVYTGKELSIDDVAHPESWASRLPKINVVRYSAFA